MLLSVIPRIPAISGNVLWIDELHTYRHAFGIARGDDWGAEFRRDQVVRPDNLAGVLQLVARDYAYPPLLDLLIWVLRPLRNPIAHARVLGLIANLGMLVVLYRNTRTRSGPTVAVTALVFVALSHQLITYSQEIKHVAFTPLLAVVLTDYLERFAAGGQAPAPRRWAMFGYGFGASLGLLIHYTFAEFLLAHLLCLIAWRRPAVRSWVNAVVMGGVLWLPWYLFAASSQLGFAQSWFIEYSRSPEPSYFHHLIAISPFLKDWLFVALALVGFGVEVEGYGRMRHFAVYALFTWVPVGIALARRRLPPSIWTLTPLVATATYLSLHTAAAIKVGFSGALQSHYLTPVVPLALVLLAQSIGTLRSRIYRMACTSAVVAMLLYSNFTSGWVLRNLNDPTNLTLDARIGSRLERLDPATEAIAYLNVQHAKSINTLYFGNCTQYILGRDSEGQMGSNVAPSIRRLHLVENEAARASQLPLGWRFGSTTRVGRTRITELVRTGRSGATH